MRSNDRIVIQHRRPCCPVLPACAPTMSLQLSIVLTAAVRCTCNILIRLLTSAHPSIDILLVVAFRIHNRPGSCRCLLSRSQAFPFTCIIYMVCAENKARKKSEVAACPQSPINLSGAELRQALSNKLTIEKLGEQRENLHQET